MKRIIFNSYLLTMSIAFALCLFLNNVSAQVDSTKMLAGYCGSDMGFMLRMATPAKPLAPPPGSLGTPPTTFLTTAIDTCGKFALYYEDKNIADGIGFDDPTIVSGTALGAWRRTTLCAAITYIQSMFDFSKISSSDLIKIDVQVSYGNAPGYNMLSTADNSGMFAQGAPGFDTTTPNLILGGYLNDYTRTGINRASGYHGAIQVNFDKIFDATDTTLPGIPIVYDENPTLPFAPCTYSLYSILLHETTHCMGWFSLVNAGSGFPKAELTTHDFSKIDSAIHIGTPYPSAPARSMIVGTPGVSLSIDTAVTDSFRHNYWANNLAAPDNHPVYSGALGGKGTVYKSFLSHLDDQYNAYTTREHISPGDRPPYVMGPFGIPGVLHSTYTKGEIQIIHDILGYSYTGPSGTALTNHVPFSKKMAAYPDTVMLEHIWLSETIPADYTMVNNGTPLIIDLNASPLLGADLADADGDSIRVDTNTVVNYMGCGNGGNNHNQLSFNSGLTKITYTPRPNFFGRVQFGFNLYDGKEDGSYYVITINVKKGSATPCTPGSNMVVNPDFEEGTEVKIKGVQETKPYATYLAQFYEGKWLTGIVSDGHPYNFLAPNTYPEFSGIAVHNSFIDCDSGVTLTEKDGFFLHSFPVVVSTYPTHVSYPMSKSGTGGERYMTLENSGASYFNIACNVLKCHRYVLEFDGYNETAASPVAENFTVGFKKDTISNWYASTGSVFEHQQLLSVTDTSWRHYTIPFNYCGTDTGTIMYLAYADLLVDNVSLTEDTTTPPPLVAHITDTLHPGCVTRLTADTSNVLCGTTYYWSGSGISGLTTPTVNVNPTVTTTYTVTVNDGCRTATDTIQITPTFITGSSSVCIGGVIFLTDTTTGGTWSSSNTAIATVSSTGRVTGLVAGTATITYTALLGCLAKKVITVYAAPPTIAGSLSVCMGTTVTLTDALTGGTWSSGTPSVASIGILTGIVTSISPGTTAITYSTPCGMAITTVTVHPASLPIQGPDAVCNTATDTLSNATAGGTWTSGSPAIATINAVTGVINGLTMGTSIITYTLPTGCYSTFTLTEFDNDSACSPCNSFGAFYELAKSGTINADLPRGNYFLQNNATVTGNHSFSNAVIYITTNDTIHVDPTSALIITGSHLFSCNMWQGIILDTSVSGTQSATMRITGNSLIEDANVAVQIFSPVTPVSGNVFQSDSAIFNRDYVGVDIENYTPTRTSYPFHIRNTVFTSRDFQASGAPGYYPGSWPAPSGTPYGLKNYWAAGGNPFIPPINIGNPTGAIGGGAYNAVLCKNGHIPYCGIQLANVGSETLSGVLGGSTYVPSAYSEIMVGDTGQTSGNVSQNLFDNMEVGIYATTTNLTSVNNAFINMTPTNRFAAWPAVALPTGMGIYAGSIYDGAHQSRLRVYSPANNPYHNVFYNFGNGVDAEDYYEVVGQKCYMVNNPPPYGLGGPPLVGSGFYGFKVSSAHYDTIDISYDTVSSVNIGIGFWAAVNPLTGPTAWGPGAPPPVSRYAGLCRINGNMLQAYPNGHSLGFGVITTQAMQLGIAAQNDLVLYGYAAVDTFTHLLNTDGNYIYDAYNGIWVNNFFKQPATSNSNTIYLRPAATNGMQAGINHSRNLGSTMYGNYVDTSGGCTIPPPDLLKAYYAIGNTAVNVSCNTDENAGRGFEFCLANPAATWYSNTMQNNREGYLLNGGLIGRQGSLTYPINDQWLGAWSLSTPQTYVYNGANANRDTIYVRSGQQPSFNSGPLPFNNYDLSSGNIQYATGSGPTCPIPPPYSFVEGRDIFEDMVRQNIAYATNIMPKRWINQMELWETIQQDTTLMDSSAAITQFASMATNSRYAYLTNVETQLYLGNIDSAQTMLSYNIDSMANTDTDAVSGVRMADSIAADNIVNNYISFYNYYIKYISINLTSEDSLGIKALAQLCPEVNGNVVFQARSLYSFIYNDLNIFENDSCIDADTTYTAEWRHSPTPTLPKGEGGAQQYTLFPNPNDGNITLQQLIADTGRATIFIEDVVGRTIYKRQISFKEKVASLQTGNIMSGVYLLQITDAEDRIFRFKFVKE